MIMHQVGNSGGNYNYNAFIYKETLWNSHFHGNYELIYGIDGNTEVTLNSIKYILSPGELILISPYIIHSLKGFPGSQIWVGVFSEDFVVSFAEKNKYANFIKFRCEENVEKILKENLFVPDRPEHYLLISYLYMVCNECVKSKGVQSLGKDNDFIYNVVNYVSENLKEDITLKETAGALNYEYHYFSSLFHKCFNMNFRNFINIFRFEQACRLLLGGRDSITEICNKCGFGSVRNFNRVFRQLSGITPGEYRNLND